MSESDTKLLDGVNVARVGNTLSVLSDELLQTRYEIDEVCILERVFVPERTCHYEYEDVTPLLGEGTYRIRRCSVCTQALKPVWNHCPECGAKVVDDAND